MNQPHVVLNITTKACNSIKFNVMSVSDQQDIDYIRMLSYIKQWVLITMLAKCRHLTM